jgi:hypothetical protein
MRKHGLFQASLQTPPADGEAGPFQQSGPCFQPGTIRKYPLVGDDCKSWNPSAYRIRATDRRRERSRP